MYEIISREFITNKVMTDMCHASSLLKLKNGTILCAWFGGSKEGNDDVSIWMSKRKDNTWSIPVKVTNEKNVHWNPVLFQHKSDEIVLFYKVGKEISKWRTMIKISHDNGITWDKAYEMVKGDEGGRGPVRNKPIRLSNERILAPGSLEDGIWSAFVDYSDDGGETWTKSNNIIIEGIVGSKFERTVRADESNVQVSEQSFFGRGVIQPTLWESVKGNIHMLLRSTEGKVYRSDSNDYGETWIKAYETSLPNNNSGIDLAKLEDGTLVLVYNPIGIDWGNRTPISLAISKDNGKTWSKLLDLDSGEGEFSYPAIIADGDEVFISYTWKRETIAFWRIKIK